MNLLAKSCFAPGLISMISNLFASAGDAQDSGQIEWIREYTTGMGHEIYRVLINVEDYYGPNISFKYLAEIGFAEF
jgi:acetyl-CoA C-acetyltransferase/potassium large conductance calcium-activated channel subfamily M alpha protein 1